MWPFSPLSPEAPGLSCGVRRCQCDWTQNLPGRQDVRSDAYPPRPWTSLSLSLSLFLFYFFLFVYVFRCPLLIFVSPIPFSFSLCCLNQASHLSEELNASIQTVGLCTCLFVPHLHLLLCCRWSSWPLFSHVAPHVPVTGHWLTGADVLT